MTSFPIYQLRQVKRGTWLNAVVIFLILVVTFGSAADNSACSCMCSTSSSRASMQRICATPSEALEDDLVCGEVPE